MQVLDSDSTKLIFVTQNKGAYCGGGTPAAVWKMTIDPNTGKMVNVKHIQMLSKIQQIRGDLFESSDGTLFTGGGWCLYKPAYYSTDDGETWKSADSGPVHPPNSVYSFVEFNGDIYAGTGYEPYHGEVYRWLGNGYWERVFDLGTVRNIVDAMAVHNNRLYVGSCPYGRSGDNCASTIPVLVSSDGDNFYPTTGIPSCYSVEKLLVVESQLVALVHDRYSGQGYIYRLNHISETWEEVATYNLLSNCAQYMVSINGVLYAYGKSPDDASIGIYESMDLGLTWKQVVVLENPNAYSMTKHDDTLYLGTYSDAHNKAYIYSLTIRKTTSTDHHGNYKNLFRLTEDVYVKGSGYPEGTDVAIYVIPDGADALPVNALASASVTTSADGDIPNILVWSSPLTVGEYDLWVDVNQNGVYDGGDVWNSQRNGIFTFSVSGHARVCSVWTTDSDGTPKARFIQGEMVYIHWNADGLIDMAVYTPDMISIEHEWKNLPSGGVVQLMPTHGNGVYEIRCTGAEPVHIAIGTFFIIPELPFFGSLLALVTMLGVLYLKWKRVFL